MATDRPRVGFVLERTGGSPAGTVGLTGTGGGPRGPSGAGSGGIGPVGVASGGAIGTTGSGTDGPVIGRGL